MTDYFQYQDRRTRPPRKRPAPDETEQQVQAPEAVDVQEHHASTTIIERIRGALLKRMRGEGL